MKFTREQSTLLAIRNVSERGFRIGNDVFEGTLALTGEAIIEDWADKPLEALEEDDFAALLESDPEVLILGTGDAQQFAPRELSFAFARRGLGLEVMESRAAARTFNVLVGEGRRVAALLYAI